MSLLTSFVCSLIHSFDKHLFIGTSLAVCIYRRVVLVVKNLSANAGDARDSGPIPGLGRSPGVGMATYSSILAWKIPPDRGSGGPQSMGLQRIGHDWVTEHAHTHAHYISYSCTIWWFTFKVYIPFIVIIRRRQWQPTPVLLPGKCHGRRSLVGCRPWGCKESDTTEWLRFHFSLSCIGEGNGNPLQWSCLENPRDGAAWWAAVYGVAQSWTRLKRLSSSSSYEVDSCPVL